MPRFGKAQLHDALQYRVAGIDRFVLRDDQRAAKGRFMGFDALIALTTHPRATSVVIAFGLVPIKTLGVRAFGSVCFDENDGQIGKLNQTALVADQAVFVRVDAFIIRTAKKFPDKLDQRSFAAARLADDFEEGE